MRPPVPPRKSGGALIIGLVALLVLAGLAVGGYFVWPYLPFSSSPSSPSNAASPPEKDKADPSGAHSTMEMDGSWRHLFNGTDLSGWKVHEVGGRSKEPNSGRRAGVWTRRRAFLRAGGRPYDRRHLAHDG